MILLKPFFLLKNAFDPIYFHMLGLLQTSNTCKNRNMAGLRTGASQGKHQADSLSVHALHSILGVSGVFVLDKSEARRVPRHPDAPQRPVVAERTLQLTLRRTIAQVTHVHLAVQGTPRRVRHLESATWTNYSNLNPDIYSLRTFIISKSLPLAEIVCSP